MEKIRLIGRGSRLSLLQMEKVKQQIEAVFPRMEVQLITRESRGDVLQDVSLHTVEGSDFFTQDIFDALATGEADLAVHSLKDMSSEHFFGNNKFAVVDRDDTRDIALFRNDIEQKISHGDTIIIGTCSPRREEMATVFLKKALPQVPGGINIVTKPIRGNVDTRLKKLDNGEFDATILAVAGLNRLLNSEKDRSNIEALLKGKKIMLLPLIECVPAPCQGAIVAEAHPGNHKAIEVLNRINDQQLVADCIKEKQTATQYGTGCLQRFGVTTITYGSNKVLYAAGKNSDGTAFSHWSGLPAIPVQGKKLFTSNGSRKSFFDYGYGYSDLELQEKVLYVANYKAVQDKRAIRALDHKRIWASGTKTWYELAKKGIWVEGSADAFGLAFLLSAWQMPLLKIDKKDVAIITNEQSVATWTKKGWKAYATYKLIEKHDPGVAKEIAEADIIFWTSYRQYLQFEPLLKKEVIHCSPSGETAEQLKAAGIGPVIFPNINAFSQWRQTTGL